MHTPRSSTPLDLDTYVALSGRVGFPLTKRSGSVYRGGCPICGLGNNRHTAESKHGRLLAHCWACDAGLPALRKKLHDLAGDHSALASARPSAPTPTKAKPVGSPTRYRCLDLNGAQRTSHPPGLFRWDEDNVLGRRQQRVVNGSDLRPAPPTREPDASQPVLVVEGDKAADALHARVRFGHRVLYRGADLNAWLDAHVVEAQQPPDRA